MQTLVLFASIGIAAGLLAGCATQRAPEQSSAGVTGSSSTSSSSSVVAAKKILNGTDYFDVYRSEFPLSERGTALLPTFLQDAGLADIQPIVGNYDALTPSLCEELYATYNVRHPSNALSDERCSWNLTSDGKAFKDNGAPLASYAKELDAMYLFVYVFEEGLGAPDLFFSTYNMQTGKTANINPLDIGDIFSLGYRDGVLYFYKEKFESVEPPTLLASFNLETQVLSKEAPAYTP